MRLCRIEIENFKGIRERELIELRPITLLFGPNSVGKSTILQALHYVREILERGNIDPDVTIAGGLIDLGGFATLVHNHELHRAVRLKVAMDLTDEQGAEELALNSGLSLGKPEFSELPVRYLVGESQEYRDYAIVQELALEIEIRWSEQDRTPYVARFAVELDGEPFAAIITPPQAGRAQLTDFHFEHSLLRRALRPDERDEEGGSELAASSPLEDEIFSLAREAAADRSTPDTPDDKLRIAVETAGGALPNLDRDLVLAIRDPDVRKAELEERTPRVNGLRALLSEMVLGPARIIRDYLGQMTYIGPLREIPTRGYRPQVTPDEARWAQGLAAWDLLYADRKGDLMGEVNRWLSGETLLRTGYRLERVEFKEVPVPGVFHQIFERGLNDDDIGDLQELYQSLPTRTEIALRDFQKGILVAPNDVGVGISQMVPVVVAALRKNEDVLAIEQPELHIHPAIQVGLGDLFIRAIQPDLDSLPFGGKTLLIETHSEHILLRLLRRIREKTHDELPPTVAGLTAEELSIIYVESDGQGVRFRPLRVDAEGEFLDQWPSGFFEERAGELF
ncbi:AAA family ATPase [Bradyrhizobium sp. SZCCHNRI3043]|uniref:AAA family ATPase n=1 Tax=Bradyrhizobium sp. SZCCHNRI3043 TaxID=3057292 RepID=UPI0028E4048A|nr:AAA family ATPase [Bradyrhizobium sp. SZCCHNRI3043]